jgi:integrase
MSIYLRGKSWYYDFIHKGQRYTGSFGHVSRSVAKEELARKKAEVVEGRLNPAKTRKSPKFNVFAEEYLAWAHANLKPATCRRLSFLIPRLLALFAHKKLSDLTSWHLEQYKKARKDEGCMASTINVELATLKAMLRKAQAWGKLADHPGQAVKPFKAIQQEARFFAEDEERRLLAASTPALRRLIQIGLLTGFRRQELANLRPEHIDFDRRTVSVAAAFSKNGESRTIPMGARLHALLHEALALRGDALTLLVTDAGISWTLAAMTSAFQRLCKQLGFGSMGPHVLRHTFASRLVMAGIDLRTVQELLGHKSIMMTMRYAHLSPDHKRLAMETLEHRFPGESPATFHNTPLPIELLEGEKHAAVQ